MNLHNRPRDAITGFDDYGFAIFNEDSQVDAERYHLYTVRRNYGSEELAAWRKLLADWNVAKTRRVSKLHAYLHRGLPPQFRASLWQKLLDTETLRSTTQFSYQANLREVREQMVDLGISEYGTGDVASYLSELETDHYRIKYMQISMDALRHILLDLDRTFPTHKMFMGNTSDAREGRAKLFRVLAVYSRYNKKVEYCQGMSSLAAMLLMQMEEEAAFWCLVSLLERHKYLHGYFHHKMSRLLTHAKVFDMLLRNRMPRLHSTLDTMGMDALMYTPPWLMCLFTSLASWDTVLAIWDLFILRGFRTIFQVGLAIMQLFEPELIRDKDLTHALPKLLRLPFHIVSHKTLVPAIWGVTLDDWEVTSLLSIIQERPSPDKTGSRKRRLSEDDQQSTAGRAEGKENGGVFEFRGEEAKESLSKRPRRETPPKPLGEPQTQPSLLRRFVNIFSTNTENGVAPSTYRYRRSTQIANRKRSTLERRRSNQRVDGRKASLLAAATNIDKQSARNIDPTGWDVVHVPDVQPSAIQGKPEQGVSPCIEAQENSVMEDSGQWSQSPKQSAPLRHSPRLGGATDRSRDQEASVSFIDSLQTASSRHTFKSFLTQMPRRSPRLRLPTPFSPPFMASPYREMKELK